MAALFAPLAFSPWAGAISGAVLGACVGSFIATWVMRWGDGRSVGGRSACDGCGRTLRAWELLPLVSWLVQRGQCRRCGGRIDPLHPLTEALAAMIGAACLWIAPDARGVALMLFGLLLLSLALFDARHFWLPHIVSAVTALFGLMLGGWAMAALGLAVPLSDRAMGAVGGFALLWLVGRGYRLLRGREGLGGGDAPMFAALGAWLGWAMLPMLLLFAALAGMAVAMVRMARPAAGGEDWRVMRLPLGTLLAVSVGPTLWLMVTLHI